MLALRARLGYSTVLARRLLYQSQTNSKIITYAINSSKINGLFFKSINCHLYLLSQI